MSRVRLWPELDPDVDLSREDVRAYVLHEVEHRLEAEAGMELSKAEKGPRKLPHRYPQSLIEGTTKQAGRLMRAMVEEIHDVLTK